MATSFEIPKTQRALEIHEQGGTEVLQVRDDVKVKLGDEEVLIKVEWAGVNFVDTYQRSGLYKLDLPTVLGNEAAGVVVKLGDKVDRSKIGYKEGDRVVAMAGLASIAQYAHAPAYTRVYKLPENVSTRDGAALVLQGLTALAIIKESHNLEKGQFALIHTVAGGTGLLLSEIVSHYGGTVIGTTSSESKAALAKAHGASYVFNYKEKSQEEIVKEVKAITGGEGLDAGVSVVYDGVGKDTFDMDFEVLKRKGTLITFGNASGPAPPVAPQRLSPKNLKLLRPSLNGYIYTADEWNSYNEIFWDLVAKGIVKVNLYKEDGYEFTTEGVKAAQEDLVSGKTTGKLVIKIA